VNASVYLSACYCRPAVASTYWSLIRLLGWDTSLVIVREQAYLVQLAWPDHCDIHTAHSGFVHYVWTGISIAVKCSGQKRYRRTLSIVISLKSFPRAFWYVDRQPGREAPRHSRPLQSPGLQTRTENTTYTLRPSRAQQARHQSRSRAALSR